MAKNISMTWNDFKSVVITKKHLCFNEINADGFYTLSAGEGGIFTYDCEIDKVNNLSDKIDYETNYQSKANNPITPKDSEGKEYVRAESRPLNKTTCFTCTGDSTDNIGNGKELRWDFSNSNDDITPSGVNYKIKRLEFSFIDPIHIKDGSIYFNNTPKGCFLNLHVVCPNGSYYLDNNKQPALATEDTVVDTFVNKHFIYGNCNMGDELNTEASSSEIPNNYKFWVDIITPDTDSSSFGHISLELYRSRTVIL